MKKNKNKIVKKNPAKKAALKQVKNSVKKTAKKVVKQPTKKVVAQKAATKKTTAKVVSTKKAQKKTVQKAAAKKTVAVKKTAGPAPRIQVEAQVWEEVSPSQTDNTDQVDAELVGKMTTALWNTINRVCDQHFKNNPNPNFNEFEIFQALLLSSVELATQKGMHIDDFINTVISAYDHFDPEHALMGTQEEPKPGPRSKKNHN